ncbi:hypothetical protein LXL04_036925 [Taraxacum kok-saghyz]
MMDLIFEVGESSSVSSRLRRSRRSRRSGYEVVPEFVSDTPTNGVGQRRRRVSRRSGYELLPDFVPDFSNSSTSTSVNVSTSSYNTRSSVRRCWVSNPTNK